MSIQANSLVAVDADRANLFGHLVELGRLVRAPAVWRGPGGVWWGGVHSGRMWLGWTWLGPGWVFDEHARVVLAEEFERLLVDYRAADEARHHLELGGLVHRLRVGEQMGRLLWAVHRATLVAHSSVLTLPEPWLASAVWGTDRDARPQHWRGEVFHRLEAATWLHAAVQEDDGRPAFGAETVLLTHVGRLTGDDDVCDATCPGRDGPPHHHVRVTIGQGFLGILENYAVPGQSAGERLYDWSARHFREAGKTGRLVTVFLPAELAGSPGAPKFTPAQRGLLRAVTRELTRPPQPAGARQRPRVSASTALITASPRADVRRGNMLPDTAGRNTQPCSLLAEDQSYVGFNGNGVRRGLGYKLGSPKGWLTRAGYVQNDYRQFLSDLRAVAAPLDLVVVGLTSPGRDFLSLGQLWVLAQTPAGRSRLGNMHMRVYTAADWLGRWPAACGMAPSLPADQERAGEAALAQLGANMPLSRIAQDLGVDKSFLSKVVRGKKRCPSELLAKIRIWLERPQRQADLPDLATQSAGTIGVTSS